MMEEASSNTPRVTWSYYMSPDPLVSPHCLVKEGQAAAMAAVGVQAKGGVGACGGGGGVTWLQLFPDVCIQKRWTWVLFQFQVRVR